MPALRPLLLAGGESSRMGSRKALLRLPNHEDPTYMRLLAVLHDASESSDVCLSLRDSGSVDQLLLPENGGRKYSVADGLPAFTGQDVPDDHMLRLKDPGDMAGSLKVQLLFDVKKIDNDEHGNDDGDGDGKGREVAGPAAGLLAAFRHDPTANWMVVACDHPMMTVAAFKQLRDAFSSADDGIPPAVTCFCNEEGFSEPLLAIWTPRALQNLEGLAQRGIMGPTRVIRNIQDCKILRPDDDRWLVNTNTPEEWQRVVEIKRKEMKEENTRVKVTS